MCMPAHDDPGVLDRGRYLGRITGDVIPGPVTPVAAPDATDSTTDSNQE